MGNVVGRTGFHVTHTKSVSERGAILDEMMRERIPGASERWAKRNPNIVVDDEGLNRAYVNNGDGRLVPCKDPKEVLAYGQQRLAKLSTPVKEPKLDPVTGKEKGGTTTSSMFVLHLPKSLCEEVKDFYPVFDEDGNEIGRRSRWVARDRKEAMRYFKDALAYMTQEVIPGGRDAILGFDIQFSESTPHIQVLADTFAPDPKHAGQLRTEFSRAYGSHRSVRDDKGRQMSGQAKFRRYHAGLKEWMLDKGWEIEADVDPLRHDKTATKDMYGAMMDKERALAEQEQNLAVERREIDESDKRLDDQWENLDIARAELKQEREQLQKDKQRAHEEARTQGYAKGLAEGRAQAEAIREQARQQLDEAQQIYGEALAAPSITDAQARNLALFGAKALADSINKNIVDPDARVIVDKSFKSMERTITKNGKLLIEQASGVERAYGNELVRKRARVSQVQEAQKSLEDDGMEF
ncbi:hypothetical protein [Actinomyces oris]|uniref:hypothetical protein n=1 Tax=Actinomyces oris TaxID=544580 RepID=UPI00288B7A33|nr:hypothetical protein [Actinomyces oris]